MRGVIASSTALLAASLVALAVPASAHHAFAAEFDEHNCRDFTGILTDIDWRNPHAFFYMDVKNAAGAVEHGSFQTYALITLKRAGTELQVFVDNFGKEIWVRGCLARNGREHYASAGTMRAADGILRQVGQIQN